MFLLLIAAVIAAAVFYYVKCLTYWKRQGVPQASVLNNFKEIINFLRQKRNFAETIELLYNMCSNGRYFGAYNFTLPLLIIKDPELLKEVTVKSFDHFPDHTNVIPAEAEPLWARNLFALKGQKWRNMRPILSPSFTSSKMKTIFVLISDCSKSFSEYYLKKEENVVEVELKDSFTRFTNDVIASAAFGLKTNSLEKQDNQFYEMGKRLTNFNSDSFIVLKFFLLALFPKFCEIIKVRLFKKEVSDFFINLIEDTLKTRKEHNIVRPDMINLLMEAQKCLENKDPSFAAQNEADLGKGVQQELTNLDIAAQALIFFFAGFESVSASMCFMAHELAIHTDIQKRLRDEIEETLENCQGNLTYEALLKMKYMDMVVSEALRKWPTASAVDRECTKPFTIQPKLPGEKPVHIRVKDAIWIPIHGIHQDPNIYPDPKRFDPERFSEENKANINPYTYLPFGLGPRNCIGSRFALLEIKIVFFYLLHNFELVPIAKTKIPLKLSAKTFNLTAEGGFWFGLKKLEK